jgi:hypothetical protein
MWLRLLALVVVAGTTAVVTTPVQAQTQIDFAPHLGLYFPMNPVVHEGAQQLTMRQLTALVFGGRIGLHVSKRWLLETTVNYSPSSVAVSANDRTVDISAGMFMASTRAALRLGRLKPKTPELQIGAGIGVVNRFGSAWRDRKGTTDPAAVFGFAGRYPLSKHMPIMIRGEIENYISTAHFTLQDGSPATARLNHDTVWSLGFEIPMNGPEKN